jgi:hypothetical protein
MLTVKNNVIYINYIIMENKKIKKPTGNNDRVIKSNGKYNMNFIDWNNEWERVAEVELKIDRGEEIEDQEEAERIEFHRNKEKEKYGVQPTTFPLVQADPKKECYICLKNFRINSKVRLLPCKHMFCDGCIMPWLKTNSTCPTCKYRLKPDPDEQDDYII